MRDSLSTQIFRADGKNVFMEVVNAALPIKKFQFNFIEYDPNTNKQTQRLDIYMEALRAATLAERILNGEFNRAVMKAKKEGVMDGETIQINDFTSYFTDMGGLSEEAVAKRFNDLHEKYPFVQQGLAVSRQLKVQAGKKSPWILRAEYGLGKSSDTGLIVPQGKPAMCINVPMTADSFFKMAMAIKTSYQAYMNQYYAKYADVLFPNDRLNVYTGENNSGNR